MPLLQKLIATDATLLVFLALLLKMLDDTDLVEWVLETLFYGIVICLFTMCALIIALVWS